MDFETWYRINIDPFPEVDKSKQKVCVKQGWDGAREVIAGDIANVISYLEKAQDDWDVDHKAVLIELALDTLRGKIASVKVNETN